MLKGKTDLSFLGIKLTIEPSTETIDDLLEDIDAVLKQSRLRLIVVVEDLDRLEPKLVNNVLFTVRRTFRLSAASYILCYDTEMLVAGKEEGVRAREFLEKFISVKLSLFVDGQSLEKFLRTDWRNEAARFPTVPADTMDRLSIVLDAVAKMVRGQQAHYYMPLLGDLRKLKRFVNAMLLMQIDKTDFGRSDFDPRDLVHLILLHLRYPGLFRRIYAEETDTRSGSFSLHYESEMESGKYKNAANFDDLVHQLEAPAQFLIRQLFDHRELDLSDSDRFDEKLHRTRACFNEDGRNLEERGETSRDQFWRVLANNARRLNRECANDAISTLVQELPLYSSIEAGDRSLRHRSIYTLVALLDRAGFGDIRGDRNRINTDVSEIAQRIFGESETFPTSLIDQLISDDRGPLGWNDLMMFRLLCCIDRSAQDHNVYSALFRFDYPNAQLSGQTTELAVRSMRRFSQEVFKKFRRRFIEPQLNFFLEIDRVEPVSFLGASTAKRDPEIQLRLTSLVEVQRSAIKTFVIYQLANRQVRSGGINCGFYDESGVQDEAGIGNEMVRYLLEFCFNPTIDQQHVFVFGDFCIRSIREASFMTLGELSPQAIASSLTTYVPPERLSAFWRMHGAALRPQLEASDRVVVSESFNASYEEYIPMVLEALDSLPVAHDDEFNADVTVLSPTP